MLERLEERLVMSSTWVSQGPGPIVNAFNVEGITSPEGPNPDVGGIAAVATSPTNANLVYVGAVNGGIWKTTDATDGSPAWTNLTDSKLPGQSIDSLALSPLDATGNTVFAGTGSTSSYAFDGSPGFGVVRTTDGGATWSVLAQSTFAGKVISSIVPTSIASNGTINTQVVMAATWIDSYAVSLDFGGVYRSTDGGTTFTRTSGSHGLPDAGVTSLVADPTNANRFYAAVPGLFGSSVAGVYESTDGGQNWTKTAALPDPSLSSTLRILLSVSETTGSLYAMDIKTDGTLSAVLRSANQGTSWASMGVPSPPIFPGGQGFVHGAIVADPSNANVVFVSGDTQVGPFPNANGANSFSGNVFRGVFSATGGTTWQNVVDNGNGGGANGSSPHADSRSMVFDANGNILQGNDGGIYRLANPNNATTRIWQSVMGNITPTEAHSAAFDSYSGVVLSGNQDNGAAMQETPGGRVWFEWVSGDGGNVAVDDSAATTANGYSIRYTSYLFLEDFNRSFWDSANNFVGFSFVGLDIVAGPGAGQNLLNYDPNLQFYQPFVLNTVDPTRMLIGTQNLYESMDQGDTLTDLGAAGGQVGFFNTGNNGMAYGGYLNGVANPGIFYVAAYDPNSGAPVIDYRASDGSPITTLSSYPGTTIEAITMDPQNDTHVFVLDRAQHVWGSFNSGSTWTNLTANLDGLANLGTGTDLRTIAIFSPSASPINTVLLVGGEGGVWQMRRPGAVGTSWTAVASGLPQVLVYDLSYNYTDNVLTAGTLGRGVWTLSGYFRGGTVTPASVTSGSGVSANKTYPRLGVLVPPVTRLGKMPLIKTINLAAVVSLHGSGALASDGGSSTGAQALSTTASGSASQGGGPVISYVSYGGRSLVNQAVVDTHHDPFDFL